MQHSRVWGLTALVALYASAQPALAYTTTYHWEGTEIFFGCQGDEDPSFPTTFPELCGGNMPAQLSVAFEHDERIWNNDAHNCDPPDPSGCDTTEFDQILNVTLSGAAFFDPTEIPFFEGIDFLGTCPGDCEFSPPFIVFRAVDALTGLQIVVFHDGFRHGMELLFADGRFLDDTFQNWGRGRTVPEPTGLTLFGLGLAGLGFLRRRQQRFWRS